MYVTQPEVKPGCVLRRANIGLLEKKKLVTDKEVNLVNLGSSDATSFMSFANILQGNLACPMGPACM